MQIEVIQPVKELEASTTPVAWLSGKLDRLAMRVTARSHISASAAVTIKGFIAKKSMAAIAE
jgi:hypothetical protein